MADFTLSPVAAFRPHHTYNDGDEIGATLTALPRSRAPSYVSTAKSSFVGIGEDDDEESLLRHARSISGTGDVKKNLVVTRVDSTVSTLGTGREKRRKLQGWRFGVACSAWIAFTALLVNTTLAIALSAKFKLNDGLGVAFVGSCETVSSWATWLHIAINVLSSILLSASNYTMQCLCSPTRKEIDRAHAKGDWVDIGVASLRNIMGRISKKRTILWWILGLSSVPIHLLYNSVVFKTLDANIYDVVVANERFLDGLPHNSFWTSYYRNYTNPALQSHQIIWIGPRISVIQNFFFENKNSSDTSLIQNLTNAECIASYTNTITTGRSDVLLVTKKQGLNASHTIFFETNAGNVEKGVGNSWICENGWNDDGVYYDGNCNIANVARDASDWVVNNAKIEYCLSRITPAHCKLQFSLQILIAVIICNAFKSGAMFWTLYKQKEATLVTLGDAVASFLDRPDELTVGRCLMAKVDVRRGPLRWQLRGTRRPFTRPNPVTFHAPLRRMWFTAASVKRWCITIALCISGLIASSTLLGLAASSLTGTNAGNPFKLGFGAVNPNAILNTELPSAGASGLISSVLLANCPQAICSFLYLAYNGLFTAMLHASEWSQYFLRPKALRVTTPHGKQRSTYYLQLPYTYSIPLLIASATLHWLISQSIFLARINFWRDNLALTADDISQTGFSCLPILLAILLGIVMLCVALGMGFRKFKSLMPVVGSCSVAISAACHPPKDDVDAAFLPVGWGEVDYDGAQDVGHCCFTSERATDLVPQRMYAGSGVRYTKPKDLDGQCTNNEPTNEFT